MKSVRIAVIAGLILVFAEAGWWAVKNSPRSADTPPRGGQQSSAQPPALTKTGLAPVNASTNSATLTSTTLTTGTPMSPTAVTGNTAVADVETEQRLGPFSLSGTDYILVLNKKKRPAGSTQESGATVTAMEIRDSAGNVVYKRTFPYQPDETEFSDAWSVSAGLLSGANGSGLLVSYDEDSEPSAPEPESSGWYQVFGVVNGKLKPFSGPILVQGDLIQTDNGSKVFKTAGALDAHSDALNFKIWAHHFRIVYPVRVDWSEGKLSPAENCDQGMGNSSHTCRFNVLPESEQRTADLTFVQLCPDATPCNHPERVVVKKDSKLELLSCAPDVKWEAGRVSAPTGSNPMDDQGGISVGTEKLELMVRIDGKEGWMHTDEDFNSLGLPFEQ